MTYRFLSECQLHGRPVFRALYETLQDAVIELESEGLHGQGRVEALDGRAIELEAALANLQDGHCVGSRRSVSSLHVASHLGN